MMNKKENRVGTHTAVFIAEMAPSTWQMNDQGDQWLVNIVRSQARCSPQSPLHPRAHLPTSIQPQMSASLTGMEEAEEVL